MKSRRKGTPTRAPAASLNKNPPATSLSSSVTPSINVSLLLRALLRSAEQEGLQAELGNYRCLDQQGNNDRDSASSHGGVNGKQKKVKKTRDHLPAPLPGYGRGKRAVSVLSNDDGHVHVNGSSGLTTSTTTAISPSRHARHSARSGGANSPRRAASPSQHGHAFAHGSTHLAPHITVTNAHITSPAPSPLARSFSFSGADQGTGGVGGTASTTLGTSRSRHASSSSVEATGLGIKGGDIS